MPLAPGTRLGPYEVTAQIGAGGMGEVYRARDAKLGRDVAIKIIPDLFERDSERLARFEREAQLLASLNHPGIAHVYGFEQSAGRTALVMELVEGATLADRIERGPLPIDEAVPIARQIGEALEAAHELGIVHRDLKPANIKVTPDGIVKVLDFGLAKSLGPASAASVGQASVSPTITSPAMTAQGIILGTAAYMAPEQARGRPVDRRADIWAFGCVLFEMLTARRAFTGADISETMAAVLRAEPDWAALPPDTPPSIRRLLTRCLRKDPKERLQHVGDARLELSAADEASIGRTPLYQRRGSRAFAAAAPVGAAIVSGVAVWLAMSDGPDSPAPPTRFAITLADAVLTSPIAIAPDGRTIVYSAVRGGVTQMYRRALGQFEATAIAGSEGGEAPMVSPDGQWVGFVAGEKLMKVPLTGGAPVTLADAPAFGGAHWTGDDRIVFGSQAPVRLAEVSGNGGRARTIAEPTPGVRFFNDPHVLPGGRAILYSSISLAGLGSAHVGLVVPETGEQRVLIESASQARYLASGHLAFVRDRTLWTVPFDRERLALTGEPQPTSIAVWSYAAAAGTFASVPAPPLRTALVWVDRQGRRTPVTHDERVYRYPRLSPDETRVAVVVEAGNGQADLWMLDPRRGSMTRLRTGGRNVDPAWFPDGTRLVFSHVDSAGERDLYVLSTAGGGAPERLLQRPAAQSQSAWSPDGTVLLFVDERGAIEGNGIWMLRPSEGRAAAFLETEFNEGAPVFSPDGRLVAYSSDESGPLEIYVRPFSGDAAVAIVSNGGGREPAWSHDGRELYYRTLNGARMMAARVRHAAGRIEVETPTVLFEGPFSAPAAIRNYDVAADGRFLMVESATPPATEIRVVVNWADELAALLAAN
jgi:Tol biopolymer transport system component